jgi:hypothetical protein
VIAKEESYMFPVNKKYGRYDYFLDQAQATTTVKLSAGRIPYLLEMLAFQKVDQAVMFGLKLIASTVSGFWRITWVPPHSASIVSAGEKNLGGWWAFQRAWSHQYVVIARQLVIGALVCQR